MTQSREQIVARVTDALKGEAGRVAVRGARKVDACGVQDHFWLTAADGVIVATGTDDEAFESACRSIGLDPADETAIIDAAGQLITPGYVDIHAHGAWEHSFDDGPEGIDIARAGHAVHGTTRQVLSLITNPIDVICANLKNVRAKMDERPDVLGAHLEGPFLALARKALMIPSASRTRFPSSSTSCWALPTAASARSPSRPSCLTASAPSSSSRRRASCRPSATATPITRPPRPVSTPARAS